MPAVSLYDLSFHELIELVSKWGFAQVHARRLWKYLYREGARSFNKMDALPAALRDALARETLLARLPVERQRHSADGQTVKYLLGLSDGHEVETVLMRCRGRATACISSQAGCPVGCVFCATGQMGFVRNLATAEIIAQVMHAERALREASGERLRNVVVMGMGEPLLNYDAVLKALEVLSDSSGLAIAAKRVTISTVGVVPGIRRLADEGRPYSLAVSLHATSQAERAALIPGARIWPLDALMDACRYYTAKLNRKIFFEWTIIDGRNDAPEQAAQLAHLLRGMPAQVNLIPLNPTAGYSGQPGSFDSIAEFQVVLRERGIPTTVRRRRGVEIEAGCGQLAAAQ